MRNISVDNVFCWKDDKIIYVLPEKELRGLPNFHVHVSMIDLYSPMVGPPIFWQQNMQTDLRSL
jgi:hypothetical protein